MSAQPPLPPLPTGSAAEAPRGAPLAPPTQPGDVRPAPRRSTWPVVVGIIAVIFGGFGVLGGLWGAVAPFVLEVIFAGFSAAEQEAMGLAAMREMLAFTVALSLALTLAALLLLVGGIQLLRRRAQAAALLRLWAWIKLPLVVGSAALQYLMQQAQMEAQMQQMGSQGPVFMQSFATGMAAATAVLALLWGWALPIFILIWFSRRKIKAEIATWP